MDHFGASLIESLEEAVFVTDRRLAVVAWNAVMERLTGIPRAEAVNRRADERLEFLRDAGLAGHLEAALRGDTAATGDVPYQIARRKHRGWLAARFAPWRDERGSVAGVIGFLVDVSERRHRDTFARALEAIGQSLTSSLDLNEVLDTIVRKAMEVTGAGSAMVVACESSATELVVLRTAGRLSPAYLGQGVLPRAGGPVSRAIRDVQPVWAANVLTDPDSSFSPERRARIEAEGFKAVAAAPLRSKGRVHGALAVHHWTERPFGDDEMAALRLLAEQAALAIDNARLYADATRRAERLRELAEVEQLVTESLVVDDVLRRITHAAARLLNAPVVQLWTADPLARVLRLQASAVEPGSVDVRMPQEMAFGEGVAGRVATSKAPIYVDDVAQDARALSAEWARESGIQRMLSVPVLAGDDLLGVLAVRARDGALSSDENRALVASLAARAAVAMQNARTYAEAVRRATRLRELVAVSRSITASLDASDVMQRIVQAAAAMRPGALAAVHLYDAERRVLRFAERSSPELEHLPTERDVASGLTGLVVEEGRPVLIPQPALHPRTLAAEWWKARPSAPYYGVPIEAGDAFVGVLDYILPEGLPDPEEQEALRLLAAQAAVAIRNARLYEAGRVQAERVVALAAVNQRISSALELDDLLRSIADAAAQLTRVRFASFWLADDAQRTLAFVGGSVPEIAADFPQAVVSYDTGAIGWVARHSAPLAVDDVFHDDRVLNRDWWQRWGLTGFVAYPVLAGRRLLAILSLSHTESIRFNEDLTEVIEMFVAQASVAIQNAHLYREAQRRRDVAEVLARLGRELSGTLDVQRIAEFVTRGIMELLDVRNASVFRYDAEQRALYRIAAAGAGAVPGPVLRPGEGVAGRAVAEGKMVMTSEAAVGIPLLARDRVVGAVALGDRPGRELTPDELQAVQALADQAALAMENARLYASAQDSLTRLRDTQVQLVQAAKMSALGQLVSGVAHELNNPLSVIIGYGQLLLARTVPDTMRRPVELMVSQGDRMAKIVRNLLYFARQRPPERAAVNIQEVMERTLALRVNQLTLSGITVETEFLPQCPNVTGDAQQLEQVFLNLLLNAEQAILELRPHGRIQLRTRRNAEGTRLFADVIDDGPGIGPDAITRVFEPFFTTKIVGTGTGLGLSVSYGIAEEHGGKLSVQSRPGETIFTLELPITTPPEPPPVVPRRPVAPGKGRVALVVEDEPSVSDLVVTLLSERGWQVDVADGGHPGLEQVRRRHYDLIISDMRMPEGDGEEFYRAVVARDPALARRFIFVTGDTANPQAWAFLEHTNVPVIEKPFPPAVFEDAVYRVLQSAAR